jgi:hypothetical protein
VAWAGGGGGGKLASERVWTRATCTYVSRWAHIVDWLVGALTADIYALENNSSCTSAPPVILRPASSAGSHLRIVRKPCAMSTNC